MIQLKDALQSMTQCDRDGEPIPFQITFDSYNFQEDKVGDRISIEKAVLLMKSPNGSGKYLSFDRFMKVDKARKNPRHWRNATRNIQVLGTSIIRKANIWLITEFNHQPVVWAIYG